MKIAIRSWLPLYDSNATRIFTLIIFCALVLRVGWVIYAQTVPGSDFYQYDLLAQRLANGQGYVDEFGEPTAFYAIGWPFSLSVIYRIFGYSLIVPQLINALLSVGSVGLTYKLSIFVLNSRSFLNNQVRSIIGCLKYVGENKWKIKDLEKVLKSKNRKYCAPPAPACGLYLEKIIY